MRSYGLVLFVFLGLDSAARAQTEVDPNHAAKMKAGLHLFKSQVRGILENNCLKCHNSRSHKADFDLSTRTSLIKSGHLGSASEDSYLMQLVRHQEEPHMPLNAERLMEKEIEAIAKWVDLGAPYDNPIGGPAGDEAPDQVTSEDRDFWSFMPIEDPAVPKMDTAWARTGIDYFILRKLVSAGIQPNELADRRTLIRRAYFDLIGLPPNPVEVQQYVDDTGQKAYENLIARLLASRHYGERWARHWLDVARFAESSGYEHDDDRKNAYHYRDFVIRAFNDDMPFDEFVRWQIAGDEIEPHEPLAHMATAFLSAGPFATQVTEIEFESTRYDELDDMVANTGLAFLGLSFGCARCHDHKFDPIPTRDYYSMVAVFGKAVRAEELLVLEPAAAPTIVQVTGEGFRPMKNFSDGRGYKHFYENVYHLNRGDVHQKQGVASPGFAQVLMRDGKNYEDWRMQPPAGWTRSDYSRTSLANWITDPEHGAGHLAARVIVNRLWQHHFGEGIVRTPNDFGLRGEAPTHPELLDWLALELIDNRWSLKHVHRLIMTSAVYMQNNELDDDRAAADSENKLHWRRVPRRLEAEAIRDSMLNISGLLDRRMFGKGSLDESMRRRSVYFTIKRSQLIPTMMLFDWPEHLVSIGKRPVTTTAPQALLMMNNPQTRKYAAAFAKRMNNRVTGDVKKRDQRDFQSAIVLGYQSAYGRDPTEEDTIRSKSFLKKQLGVYSDLEYTAAELAALTDFAQVLFTGNEFIFLR